MPLAWVFPLESGDTGHCQVTLQKHSSEKPSFGAQSAHAHSETFSENLELRTRRGHTDHNSQNSWTQ